MRGSASPSSPSVSSYSQDTTGGASPRSQGDDTDYAAEDDRDRLQFPCGECKKGKVRCDYRIPCSRCFRLGRECRAQDRAKRGRPVKVKEYTHQKDEMGMPFDESSSSSGGYPALSGADQAAYFTLRVSLSPVEMYIYRHAGNIMVRTTSRMKDEGSLDIPRAVASTLMVNAYSAKVGKDVSLGVTEAGYSLLGLGAFPPVAATEPNLHASDSQEVDGQFTFDRLPLYIRELWDSWIASAVTVLYAGEYYNYCNPVFEESYWSTDEARALIKNCGILNLLTLARLFHPEDLQEVYEAFAYYMLGPPEPLKEMTKVCKCISKQGVSRLSLVRYRLVLLPCGGAAGVLSVIPLPRSPYVRDLNCSLPTFQPQATTPRFAMPPTPVVKPPPLPPPPFPSSAMAMASYASQSTSTTTSFSTPPSAMDTVDELELLDQKPPVTVMAVALAVGGDGSGPANNLTIPPEFDFDAFLQGGTVEADHQR